VRALLAGESFPMTAGTQTRDFVYVDDVVDGIVRALTMTERHDSALHLSAGQGVAIRDVARLAAAAVGPGAYGLLQLDAVPYREGEAMAYWADNTESRIRLGWTPRVSLEEGLRRTVAYFRGDTGGV
jgi:UDP-glucose 4-epimerase